MDNLYSSFFRIVGRIFGLVHAEYRQIANRYWGKIHRFDGDASAICQQVVDELWQGDFYRTSLGHFNFFWMRDFGTVAEQLTHLGYEERVHHTLRWALRHYRRAKCIKTCIDNAGNVFNAPLRSVDSMPWLMHSIVASGYQLNKSERKFLEQQLEWYSGTFLHPSTGMMIPQDVGEMRDAVKYDRSAYAVALIGRMAQCVKILGLKGFVFPPDIYRKELIDNYWNGTYFSADATNRAFSAECALFPFYFRVIDDAQLAGRTFDYIHRHKLNRPYPLKYTDEPEKFNYRFWMDAPFMPDYAGTCIWSWHGVFYLKLLKRYRRPEFKREHQLFTEMIERHKTWPEMLAPDGSWYLAPIYKGDPGMVWAALYLDL